MKIVINEKQEINNLVSNEIIRLVKSNPQAVLGLATGGTPLGIYEELIKDHQENKTDYSNIITFNLDEYYDLDPSHPESYHSYMDKNLFSGININPENTHFPDMNNPESYTNLIEQHKIDFQILGVGSNGHIGFNEPGTSFESITHYVTLAESTRKDNARFFNSLDEVPAKAVTMGLKDIIRSKRIVLIAFGANKAQAIKQLVDGTESETWPVTILQRHPYVTLYLDKEAASLL
ncbi:MAG: glucosamine-6-phosphate deaminase [Acholeplasmataceae bacterium]|jgi:glucosamine-6-phosphate deaminase|nr:glucosamine-6-phosphate deaminase [Acholeplasmataceae bacterium]MDD4203690.1 glucosamine-6-phosphate deaminase [Acholeplasmataceae bacterium]MDD4468520.1 glucosamine-6-phosphate deaminase [Acholeplasmataceae bacterium]MDD4824237.1 glucosamine-6-phosphate deaminase [Acholeplasmataceae bacterium]MDY0316348.1 glucosamine-6-phosphate deaminase [Acholeplasmatales bacterium]